MRRSHTVAVVAAALTSAVASAFAAVGPVGAADPGYSVQTLHFLVHVGPTGTQACDVIGDLYTPSAASATHRVPAILTTNGFGGSKNDQAGIGTAFAQRGYAVLSYSGLGFGGSGCKITLDDPDYDGKAASQLVSYLGGAPGIAFTDAAHKDPAPALDVIVHDAVDHRGQHDTYDPRVGMVGGSYGGENQFATADVDPRVDTIVPIITWNDLSYSLAPNNAVPAAGAAPTPGAVKLTWGLGFSGLGIVDGLADAQADPSRLLPCPNFATFVCPALVTAGTTGYFQPSAIASLRHASVATYMKNIRIPVLLVQGENDTLFNLNEAVANYYALRAQGTPVSMIWQSWGHSDGTPAPGEIDLNSLDPATQYETGRISNWFDHYLKGSPVSTGPAFAYFRPWVSYTGNAAPAYASSASFPVGTPTALYLSGDKSLTTSAAAVRPGTQAFLTPPAGLPSSIDPLDVLGFLSSSGTSQRDTDLPATSAAWTTVPLRAALDVAGSPTLTVRVTAPATALTEHLGPLGQLVLFVKVEDVDASGTASLVNGDVAPVRVADVTKPITVSVPAMVHRFAAGHRIRLVIAGGSLNYRGGVLPAAVSVAGGAAQVLTLPTV